MTPSDTYATEMLLRNIYALVDARQSEMAVDVLFEALDHYATENEEDRISDLLLQADPNHLDKSCLVVLSEIGRLHPQAHHAWQVFMRRAMWRLHGLDPVRFIP